MFMDGQETEEHHEIRMKTFKHLDTNDPPHSDWLSYFYLQAAGDDVRTNHRPDFIQLSNQSPDMEDLVLYPDQWEDRVSLAER